MNKIACLLVFLCACGASLCRGQDDYGQAAPFEHGETICFLGDSITKSGDYQSFVELYYATRFPERTLRFINCGVGGDRASTIMLAPEFRLRQDVLAHKPSTVMLMLGMNDVERDAYGPNKDSSQEAEKRQTALRTYDTCMRQVIEILRRGGARLILVTPSIYDETAQLANPLPSPLRGVNGALGQCAELVKNWAREYPSGLVDCYGVMNAVNRREQAKNRAFSIVGAGKDWNDRVHPGPVGSFVMAYALLKAQHLPRYVSRIVIDARVPRAVEQGNCRVDQLNRDARGGVAFDCLEHALPLVVPANARGAMELIPFMDEFNREELAVYGLTPGDYELHIDGKTVGSFSSTQLEAGINLAANEKTPQYLQSAQATRLNEQIRRTSENLRESATLRYSLARRGMDSTDPSAYERVVREEYVKAQGKGKVGSWLEIQYQELQAPGALQKRHQALLEQRALICKPQVHHFQVQKVQ